MYQFLSIFEKENIITLQSPFEAVSAFHGTEGPGRSATLFRPPSQQFLGAQEERRPVLNSAKLSRDAVTVLYSTGRYNF